MRELEDKKYLKYLCKDLITKENWYPKIRFKSWVTYCNFAVNFIMENFSYFEFNNKFANDIVDIMTESPVWKPVSFVDGFISARSGKIVIASQKGLKHGHVAVLYPADFMQVSGSFGGEVPMVLNMGMTVGIVHLGFAFSKNPMPKLYLYDSENCKTI